MVGLHAAALTVLGVVVIFRMPSAIREPRSRLSWLASLVGTLALLTLGTVIPQSVIDQLFGGTNFINLAQNLLCTIAFWLVMQAAISHENSNRRIRWWPLVAALIAFTIPFLLIQRRGATEYLFIPDHLSQAATWLYASIYMGAIAGISVLLLTGIRGRRAKSYWFFKVGAPIVIAACVDEIAYLTLEHFELIPPAPTTLLYDLFDPFFYVGVILIVAGIASFTLIKRSREFRLQLQLSWLRKIIKRRGISLPPLIASTDTLAAVYDHVIAVRDRQATKDISLSRTESAIVGWAERLITNNLASPAVTHHLTHPPSELNGFAQ